MSFEFEARFFGGLLARAGLLPERVLVVGCGAGVEVGHLARAVAARVVGVDLSVDPAQADAAAALVRADARALPFRSGAFQAVYCYHVLEHVPEPAGAVDEARRVLAPGGLAYYGTPNKSRIVGYVGGRANLIQKVIWNLVDYGRRLTGRWSNERGAHAGFTDRELERLLSSRFARVESVSRSYYVGKYPRLASLWRASFRLGLHRLLAPSVYFQATGEADGRDTGGPRAGSSASAGARRD